MNGLETPAILAGVLILLVVLWDTFETMILPRSAGPGVRLTRSYYEMVWRLYTAFARCCKPDNPFRYTLLGTFGPLSLVYLIMIWAALLILGFALITYGTGEPLALIQGGKAGNFGDYLYLSGVTLFTLGYGDKAPGSSITKILCVLEAGVGFGLLATVIGYLPTLYQTFARREAMVLRLHNRAGTPPSAQHLLDQHRQHDAWIALESLLAEWETWGAELQESYRAYPVLAFYRSQKDSQSWLTAAVTILEICVLLREECPPTTPVRGALLLQADATYGIISSALHDLARVLQVIETINSGGIMQGRQHYEPIATALADHLLLTYEAASRTGV